MDATINSLSLSDLPAALQALVRAAIGRAKVIRSISMSFTTELASASFGWRSEEAFTYGSLVSRKTDSWTGDDGESNVTVTDYYSAPVATATKARGGGVFVHVAVGNLTEEQAQAMSDAIYNFDFDIKRRSVLAILPVIVDASLAQQPEVTEDVVLISQWNSTNVGGTKGSDPEVRVARSSITNAAKMVTARPSKPAPRPAPALDANAEAMLAAGWLS